MLNILNKAPDHLWDCESHELAEVLGGPALIRVPGQEPRPLFIATLLHGNESTGWNAVRALLRSAAALPLPRAVTLLIGNVHAARHGLRHLDEQPDFNRIWCDHLGPESVLAAQVLAEITRDRPIACVDLHNTSGENPVYGCVHRLDDASSAIARHFSDTLVLVRHPESLLSMALSPLCPSITVECGKPGNQTVTERISERLLTLLADTEAISKAGAANAVASSTRVLRSVARVRIPEHLSFTMSGADADLQLDADLERHNFQLIPAGTVIATIRHDCNARLEAFDDQGIDVADQFFRREGDALVAGRAITPSMFTPSERIVRQDCLCYLMECVPATGVT